MSTIDIKDLANAGDVHELTDKEMKNINGGQKADIGGWSALGAVFDAIVAPAPSIDQALEYLKGKAGKS